MPSNPHLATDRIRAATGFVEAVAERDFERAESLWPELSGTLSDDVYSAAVDLFAERERWREAAETLLLIRARAPESRLRLNLFRNFDALRTHRPEVYRAVVDVDTGDAVRIVATASGKLSVALRIEGVERPLACGPDPAAAQLQIAKNCADALRAGTALALGGVGDGYVLAGLAAHVEQRAHGREQAVFVFEPDARVLFACLLIHDWSGPLGPIAQERVRWYVGPRWGENYRIDAVTDRFLPFPVQTIKLAPDSKPIDAILAAVLNELSLADLAATRVLQTYYASVSARELADACALKLGRPPRVSLLTTRFSSVIQYSTRDTAEAFRELGWETQLLIEPSAWHATHKVGLRRSFADFKPDLVFQIDHNRFEHGDLLPVGVPFVNWVQDMLPHLMLEAAGRQLHERDFALVPSAARWTAHWAYPERQCLEMRKLTRVPLLPTSWTNDEGLIVYVSNWSRTPELIAREMTETSVGVARDFVRAACDRIIDAYARGDAFPTAGHIRRLVLTLCDEGGLTLSSASMRAVVNKLFDRINNACYRQQGLRWALEYARTRGKTLAIYGDGWDQNPEFGRVACGPVVYGAALEALTRRAAVNLILEPYVCVAHQRMPDAVAAGGFCVVRDHPNNHTLQALSNLLPAAGDLQRPVTTSRLAAALTSDQKRTLDDLLRQVSATDASPGELDHVLMAHAVHTAGMVVAGEPLFPHWRQTAFSDDRGLAQRLDQFLDQPALRESITTAQRVVIDERFAYSAGLRRVTRFIETRLRGEGVPIRKAA